MAMNKSENSGSDWQACPEGTMASFSAQHRRKDFGQLAAKVGGACLAVLLCIGTVAFWPKGDTSVRQISCYDTLDYMDGYFGGTLSSDDMLAVEKHCENCKPCKRKYMKEAGALGVEFLVNGGNSIYNASLVVATSLSVLH